MTFILNRVSPSLPVFDFLATLWLKSSTASVFLINMPIHLDKKSSKTITFKPKSLTHRPEIYCYISKWGNSPIQGRKYVQTLKSRLYFKTSLKTILRPPSIWGKSSKFLPFFPIIASLNFSNSTEPGKR